jgi:ketosteroid isomerase-like protein
VTDEVADRLAIRALVDAYAHGVDRRDPEGVAALFTDDGVLAIYEGDPSETQPARVRRGRGEIATALERLSRYRVTTHFLGQHSVELAVGAATGETYCMAHHLSEVDGGVLRDRVLAIRYLDRFVRVDGVWRIAERVLVTDWADDRAVSPPDSRSGRSPSSG